MNMMKPPSTQVQPLQPLDLSGKKKKQGSGYQGLEKTVQQNVQPVQAIGSQIQQGLQQQVQGAQGQLQGAVQAAGAQTQAETQRLGQAQGLIGTLQNAPTDVNKELYKNLSSGKAQTADTGGIQAMQGTLGSAVEETRNIGFDPMARQQAIARAAGRSLTSQPRAGALGALDSSLLARSVNLQTAANEAARQGFSLDREAQKQAQSIEASNKALAEQAKTARENILKARTQAITGLETGAKEAAEGYNEQVKALKDFLGKEDLLTQLTGQPVQTFQKLSPEGSVEDVLAGGGKGAGLPPSAAMQIRNLLSGAGIDLDKADITDIGQAELISTLRKAATGLGPRTAEEAMTADQRKRLKSLYGLEDELAGREYLDKAQADMAIGLDKNVLENLRTRIMESEKTTAQRASEYEAAMNELLGAYNNRADVAGYFNRDFESMTPEQRQAYIAGNQDEADLRAAFRRAAEAGSFDDIRINDLAEQMGIGWGRAQNLIEQMRPYLQRGQTATGESLLKKEGQFVGQDIGGPAYGRRSGSTFFEQLNELAAAPVREVGRSVGNLAKDEALVRLGPISQPFRESLNLASGVIDDTAKNPFLTAAMLTLGPGAVLAGGAGSVAGLNTAGQALNYASPQILSALDRLRKG